MSQPQSKAPRMLLGVVAVAVLIAVMGSFLPWYTLSSPNISGTEVDADRIFAAILVGDQSRSGTYYGDGWVVIVLATFVILTVGGFYLRGKRWMVVLALLSSIGIAAIAVGDWMVFSSNASEINAKDPGGLVTASVGGGLYLVLVASVPLLVCTGYLTWRRAS